MNIPVPEGLGAKVTSRKFATLLLFYGALQQGLISEESAVPAGFLAVFYIGCETLIDIARIVWAPKVKPNENSKP